MWRNRDNNKKKYKVKEAVDNEDNGMFVFQHMFVVKLYVNVLMHKLSIIIWLMYHIIIDKIKLYHTHFTETNNDVPDGNVQQSIDWLQEHQAPWEEVKLHWERTFEIRRKSMLQANDTVLSALVEKWNILKHPSGHELIEFDFTKMRITEHK